MDDSDIGSEMNERDQNIENLGDHEIINEEYKQNQQDYDLKELLPKSPKLLNKVFSHLDKIDHIQILQDGTVEHQIIRIPRKQLEIKKTIKNKKHA